MTHAFIVLLSFLLTCGFSNSFANSYYVYNLNTIFQETTNTAINELLKTTSAPVEKAPDPIVENGTMRMSLNEFAERYNEIINTIDPNFTYVLGGLSTSKIYGGYLLKNDAIGVTLFQDKSGNDVGGSGNEHSVVANIQVLIMTEDTYQQGVLLPAILMTLDETLSYDKAWDVLNQICSTEVGVLMNDVIYAWIEHPQKPSLHILYIGFDQK